MGLGSDVSIAERRWPQQRGSKGAAKGQQKGSKRAAKGQQTGSKRAARDWTFPSPKGGGPIEGEQMQKPRTGRGRTGGLSLAAGTSQAPQLVAPEANIRRDDHRGLHDARRRFNLAKSHGAR